MGKQWDDEGGRGRRNDRGAGGGFRPGGGGDFQPRAPRGPLQWNETHRLVHGETQAVISTATGDTGDKLYSFTIGRAPRGDKAGSKFLVPNNYLDIKGLVDAVQAWIENDRASHAAV